MTRAEVKRHIIGYLKERFITFYEGISNSNGAEAFTMIYKNHPDCPGEVLESCLFFYPDGIEARVYFSEAGAAICKNSPYRSGLFRLFNFINAKVFPACSDGTGGKLYAPEYLYTTKLYMTEDDCFDITLTTLIPYAFFSVTPLRTEDFLTAGMPELLDALSLPIFGVLSGKLTAEEAVSMVRGELIEK